MSKMSLLRGIARCALLAATVSMACGPRDQAIAQTAPAPAAAQAQPGFPQRPTPPAGAPNVLIIMTDDVGFAASSTFGGVVPTPTFDRLAQDGLRYANFHTTALCSPTRAALLTGRNHHAVGFGEVPELARGTPGYNSIIPSSAGSIGEILSAAGYDTAWLGKNHNVPTWQAGPLGPYDQWASGLGFNYFYGFHGGWTNQFAPALIENNNMIEPPDQPGYILDRDLADHAIGWLRTQRTQSPERPFLLYYAPGTAHAPVQAPADWIARFRGRFDAGWDVFREQIFQRQRRMGVIPSNARLPPLPEGVRPWAELSPDEQRVNARYMEAYAAALAYCDAQIGRVIDDLRESGQLDNTLIIYIQGDNGASAEGGQNGAFDYVSRVNGSNEAEELAHSLAHLDDIGGPRSLGVGPAGWAVAMDTPYPYYKTVASRLGGVTNGMVVSWPAGIRQRGVRMQFVDATDIAPTILEAAGIAAPDNLEGVAQQPFDGVSFAYSFADPRAHSRHATQYFEVMEHAAIYQDGWFAASRIRAGQGGHAQADLTAPWQLYDLAADPTQLSDVAAQHPERLAELREVFQSEAARNHVLPQFAPDLQALLPIGRPEIMAEPGRYTFYPSAARLAEGVFPSINNRSWSLEAELDAPAQGGDGVLVTQGGYFGGWGLALLNRTPTFLYRATDRDGALFRLASSEPLSPGHHVVSLNFTVDGAGLGSGGEYVMSVDGRETGRAHVERTVPLKFSAEDATIGRDAGTPLTDEYRVPFAFDGALRVTIELGPLQLPPSLLGPRPESEPGE